MILSAHTILPISRPAIERGALLIREGLIEALGPQEEVLKAHPNDEHLDLGEAILLPGLCNLHTHLEYTALGPLRDQVPFASWISDVVYRARGLTQEDWVASYRAGLDELIASGVTFVADVGRRDAGLDQLIASGLKGIYFLEFVAVDDERLPAASKEFARRLARAREKAEGTRIRIGIFPHSPYTLSGEALRFIFRLARQKGLPVGIHVAESKEEVLALGRREGPLIDFLQRFGLNTIPPGGVGSAVLPYLARCGFLNEMEALAVHGGHLPEEDMAMLRDKGATLALCARSNWLLENSTPSLSTLLRSRVSWGVGTDSRASNIDLNLWNEMRFLLGPNPSGAQPSAADLVLQGTTCNGTLRFGLGETGALEPGKRADVIALRLKESTGEKGMWSPKRLLSLREPPEVIVSLVEGDIVFRR
jgi:5-methylthioadenosine/S-adenosylhomocysteine deaminase